MNIHILELLFCFIVVVCYTENALSHRLLMCWRPSAFSNFQTVVVVTHLTALDSKTVFYLQRLNEFSQPLVKEVFKLGIDKIC